MDTKNVTVSLKAGPDDGLAEGQFSAYASVFGNVDSYGDVVAKGAFSADLEKWKSSGAPIPVLFGHNMSDPDFNIGHVLAASEDDHGLLVTAQLDLESPKAAQVYRLLKGRRINQMSFAYDVLDSGQTEVDGVKANELRQLKLYEVSVVPIGANQQTEVLSVKSQDQLLTEVGKKVGKAISAANESQIQEAADAVETVLDTLTSIVESLKAAFDILEDLLPGDTDEAEEDQEDASDSQPPKDEAPAGKSSEAMGESSVRRLAATIQLLAMKGAA